MRLRYLFLHSLSRSMTSLPPLKAGRGCTHRVHWTNWYLSTPLYRYPGIAISLRERAPHSVFASRRQSHVSLIGLHETDALETGFVAEKIATAPKILSSFPRDSPSSPAYASSMPYCFRMLFRISFCDFLICFDLASRILNKAAVELKTVAPAILNPAAAVDPMSTPAVTSPTPMRAIPPARAKIVPSRPTAACLTNSSKKRGSSCFAVASPMSSMRRRTKLWQLFSSKM